MPRLYLENVYAPSYFFGVVVSQERRTYLGMVNIWRDWVYVVNAKVYNYFSRVWFSVPKQLFHASEIFKITPFNKVSPKTSDKDLQKQRTLKDW